ncbi:MAG: WGR domain-containing protein [Planctomycetia bacterium]|nr:WGR domain-containing protein [Planctomycetia bacterium]
MPKVKASPKSVPATTPALVAAAAPAAGAVVIPVDDLCHLKSKAKVHENWDAMLNQTNIGANNNKYYVIQLLESGGKYYTWTRWGRVGEPGQNALLGNGTLDDARKCFEGKFKDKSGNAWADRAKFVAKPGKYALIEIERSAEAAQKAAEVEEKLKAIDQEAAKLQPKPAGVAPSKLHAAIERFMGLIFDHDMFKGAMASFDIDVKKMPLGQLTKTQVQKGYAVLEELEDAVTGKARNRAQLINEVSSRFYTLIPHAFGRRVPPPIDTPELLHKKFDMLNVLNDIEIALGLENKKSAVKDSDLKPNPADENYQKLKAHLEYVDPDSKEFKFIETYTERTGGHYKLKVVDVFRVNRHGEGDRFAAHKDIVERKLLWHGTNVAVVAAILGSGLRIMPHSGGRVGKGIYLASENGKSAGYVGWSGRTGVMFLAEAALGKEHTITRDDSSLRCAPKGCDCIVARGHTEPDPQHDIEWEFEGKKVVVPQGKPIKSKYTNSSFTQSEYLLYKESQARLRYVLRLQH